MILELVAAYNAVAGEEKMANAADSIRRTRQLLNEASLAMTPVSGGKVRQVEKPPKAPKSKSDSKAPKKQKPVTPGDSGSKSAKKSKSVKSQPSEHIEGDSHVLNFKHGDQDLTGWIEDRGDGTFDVAVVCGKFTVVKSVTKDNVAKKVKAAAAKLCGSGSDSDEIDEGKPDNNGRDVLVKPDTEEEIPGDLDDNDEKETSEFVPWMFKGKGKKSKKKVKEEADILRADPLYDKWDDAFIKLMAAKGVKLSLHGYGSFDGGESAYDDRENFYRVYLHRKVGWFSGDPFGTVCLNGSSHVVVKGCGKKAAKSNFDQTVHNAVDGCLAAMRKTKPLEYM